MSSPICPTCHQPIREGESTWLMCGNRAHIHTQTALRRSCGSAWRLRATKATAATAFGRKHYMPDRDLDGNVAALRVAEVCR